MVLQHCFSIADPDANFKFSLIVATENSAGRTSVFLVLRVSTLFRIPTTVLLLMDLLYSETATVADRICIEFPSRNATLCEEVEIAINQTTSHNNYCSSSLKARVVSIFLRS